jgi:signal transduction histidine kinase
MPPVIEEAMAKRSDKTSRRAKTQRRKTTAPKRRTAAKAGRRAVSVNGELSRLRQELTDALARETATSEVLRVISSSPGELKPVFDFMLENATRICEAEFGVLSLRQDAEGFRVMAMHNAPIAFADLRRREPTFQPSGRMGALMNEAFATRQALELADIAQGLTPENDPLTYSFCRATQARSIILVPLLKDDDVIGSMAVFRQEVRPFNDKQIGLLTNFARQAVIAIENTRLLNELQQRTDDLTKSLDRQTATSEILASMSGSPTDSKPVFDAIVRNLLRLFGSRFATVQLLQDGMVHLAALGGDPGFEKLAERYPLPFDDTSMPARAMRSRHVVQVSSITGNPEAPPASVTLGREFGFNSTVFAPMLRGDQVVGAIGIANRDAQTLDDKQIALIRAFADQAVIAIENTRLFNELRQRTTDLSKSLDDLRAAQDRLVQTEKLASLGQLTAGIAHEIKNPLNFVNNFSSVSVELIDELQAALEKIDADEKTRVEIGELADTLRDNLDKIAQHGKRADSIVKNMLLHSREGSGERRPVEINAMVEESLNLAYHGARAEKQGFNITLERSFDPAAGEADLFAQEITRVLLNLIANGFYAATKRKAQSNDNGYEPRLAASTRNLGDRVEIRIRDNGTGIPPEVKAKMFNPFFTTKPAGEGTGLGLSLSHDIVVKQHAGSIEVDTEPGAFTEIRIVLPRLGAAKP